MAPVSVVTKVFLEHINGDKAQRVGGVGKRSSHKTRVTGRSEREWRESAFGKMIEIMEQY
jgi:hypothetical protein